MHQDTYKDMTGALRIGWTNIHVPGILQIYQPLETVAIVQRQNTPKYIKI